MKEIALHILDITENSIAAGADRVTVSVRDEEPADLLHISIEDNGKGMGEEELHRLSDPFYTSRTTRRVGMGIPLFRQHAEMAGGGLTIRSEKGVGTKVEATFHLSHPDRQPLGDLEGSWMLLVSANPDIEWELVCSNGAEDFSISSSEIRLALGVESIQGTELTSSLRRMIRNNLDELGLN
ncbi:MAG: ATP-binding protein [Bacteroidota bacterium]|nr:ATP-binding protein [Bacteroidota bacterium]